MRDIDVLKWLATVVTIGGAAVNSLGYYPEGPITLTIGNFLWLIVAIIWKESSIILTNIAMLIITVGGLAYRLYPNILG